MSKVREKLAKIEELIAQARGEAAQEALKGLRRNTIPQELIRDAAMLARRASLPQLALSFLRPVVRPTKKMLRPPTPEDAVEYAASLLRVGIIKEAQDLLRPVPAEVVPISLLYRAMLCFKEWNYAEAVPLLRSYLDLETNEYRRFNGKLNLAGALVFLEQYGEAETLLNEILAFSRERSLSLLEANCLQYLGALCFYRLQWDEALEWLEKSATLLKNMPGLDALFVKKWIALTRFYKSNATAVTLKEVHQVRKEAQAHGHWETVRDLDFHEAKLTQDTTLATYLYFGTPFQSLKDKIRKAFPHLDTNQAFALELGGVQKGPRLILNIDEENETSKGSYLKAGQSMHRLYRTLLSDFYRPFGIVALFEKIFPGEFYTGETSEHRVRQAIKKLRKWFEQNHVPLLIEPIEGEYKLSANKPCAIPIHGAVLTQTEFRMDFLFSKLGQEFMIKDASYALGLSRRSALLVVQNGISEGKIEKISMGRTTRYRFTDQVLKKAS